MLVRLVMSNLQSFHLKNVQVSVFFVVVVCSIALDSQKRCRKTGYRMILILHFKHCIGTFVCPYKQSSNKFQCNWWKEFRRSGACRIFSGELKLLKLINLKGGIWRITHLIWVNGLIDWCTWMVLGGVLFQHPVIKKKKPTHCWYERSAHF